MGLGYPPKEKTITVDELQNIYAMIILNSQSIVLVWLYLQNKILWKFTQAKNHIRKKYFKSEEENWAYHLLNGAGIVIWREKKIKFDPYFISFTIIKKN